MRYYESPEWKAASEANKTQTTKFKKLVVAVEHLLGELEDDHGGGHHDDGCPICKAVYKVEEAAGLEHDR